MTDRPIEVHIASWKMIPSTGGVFEFAVNGELLFSKKSIKRHAEPGEIKKLLEEKIAAMQ